MLYIYRLHANSLIEMGRSTKREILCKANKIFIAMDLFVFPKQCFNNGFGGRDSYNSV